MSASLPPVIVIGMHRSGTSLLARLLRAGGVFMGAWRNNHDEAQFFFRHNRRIFRMAHTYWDRPEPVRELLRVSAVREAVVADLRQSVASLTAVSYLGWKHFLRMPNLETVTYPWGWKEPRTSYTLPLWLELFPAARIIHLSRHGVDVADSLRRRERSRKTKMRNKLFSIRCLSLEGAFALWAEYEAMCLEVVESVAPERVLRLRYEDLITAPRRHLAEVMEFAGVAPAAPTVDQGPAAINSERAFAFRRDPELMRFFQRCRDHSMLQRYGYDRV